MSPQAFVGIPTGKNFVAWTGMESYSPTWNSLLPSLVVSYSLLVNNKRQCCLLYLENRSSVSELYMLSCCLIIDCINICWCFSIQPPLLKCKLIRFVLSKLYSVSIKFTKKCRNLYTIRLESPLWGMSFVCAFIWYWKHCFVFLYI